MKVGLQHVEIALQDTTIDFQDTTIVLQDTTIALQDIRPWSFAERVARTGGDYPHNSG